jgi:hypothetical protein
MTQVRQGTEFRIETPQGWVDESAHTYRAATVEVTIGRYAPVAAAAKKLEQALERFRLAVANYELVERSKGERPIPGSELVAHRIRTGYEVFEISVFWPIGDLMWVFRARSLVTAEDECWAAARSFMESYKAAKMEEPDE